MKTKLLTVVMIWILTSSVFAQKEHYVWYFGDHAGIDFNSGAPVALTNGAIDQLEGCSSISDGNGNLLFYTDGITVWDSSHTQMPNGYSLDGGHSSTQSALIIPFPGNNLLYYIFTVDEYSFGVGQNFCYSIVDMSLNSGKGDITIKNNIIDNLVTEKLTAVRHANGNDVWVVIHDYNTANFNAYLITASGIGMSPVVSTIGPVITGLDAIGYMKFTADGEKIAYAAQTSQFVDLFDFNASTGVISNEIFLSAPGPGYAYGIEFSQSAKYLYCAKGDTSIYQWDISSGVAATINATLQVAGSGTSTHWGMQMGPDGKIYVSLYNEGVLGVINYPDSSGVSCNYIETGVSLNGKFCQTGLPNFITSYFLPTGISILQPPTSNFQISPNPASDKITVSFGETITENVSIKIYNITGAVVLEKEIKSTSPITGYQLPVTNYRLPVTNITNGIYFLSVQTEEGVVTRKMVVNH